MAQYTLTNKAVEDLNSIWNYTFDKWSEGQADHYYQMLLNAFRNKARDPSIGKKYIEIDSNIYGFKANRHTVFYQRRNVHSVLILRILHERMDLINRLTED